MMAQDAASIFNKPPEDVDRALRARINEFYEDHVTGKFREAENLVADDTKDFFYNGNKPRYLSFSIQSIQYFDNFTKAKATILCEQYVMFPGFENKPMKIPTPSYWKLVDGQWYWYVDPQSLRQSPFGMMTPGTTTANASNASLPSPSEIPTSPDFIMNQVKTDKQSVELKPGKSAEVTIYNSAPGPMTVSIADGPKGIDAQFTSSEIPAKNQTRLILKAGRQAKSGTLNVNVRQTGETIPIQITVR